MSNNEQDDENKFDFSGLTDSSSHEPEETSEAEEITEESEDEENDDADVTFTALEQFKQNDLAEDTDLKTYAGESKAEEITENSIDGELAEVSEGDEKSETKKFGMLHDSHELPQAESTDSEDLTGLTLQVSGTQISDLDEALIPSGHAQREQQDFDAQKKEQEEIAKLDEEARKLAMLEGEEARLAELEIAAKQLELAKKEKEIAKAKKRQEDMIAEMRKKEEEDKREKANELLEKQKELEEIKKNQADTSNTDASGISLSGTETVEHTQVENQVPETIDNSTNLQNSPESTTSFNPSTQINLGLQSLNNIEQTIIEKTIIGLGEGAPTHESPEEEASELKQNIDAPIEEFDNVKQRSPQFKTFKRKTVIPGEVIGENNFEEFENINTFSSQSTPQGTLSTPVPFCILLKDIRYIEEASKIIEVVKKANLNISADSLAKQAASGKMILENVSEYTAIFIARNLRTINANFLIAPSQELDKLKKYFENSSGKKFTPKLEVKIENQQKSVLKDLPIDFTQVAILSSDIVPGETIAQFRGVVASSKVLPTEVSPEAALDQYGELVFAKIRQKALFKQANAIVGANIFVQNIFQNAPAENAERQYHLVAIGTAVRLLAGNG